MRILVACVIALFFCLGMAWWVRTDGPSVDGRAEADRNDEVRPGITAILRNGSGWQSPPSWIPADAERDDDRGALLTWVATDAERENDQGVFLTWIATDAERDDDIGVPMHGSGHPP